jgi:hypothetical protein
MDDGQPCIAIYIALRVWVSCSSNYVRGYLRMFVIELTSFILAGGGHTVSVVFMALWSFY